MKISDLLKLSTDNLRRRKGRTLLTLIGVVIGTCLIVVMISLGIALNKQYEEMLRSYGDLTKIDSLVITTNAQYNGGFDLLIGEIGMYEGEAGSGTFTKLLHDVKGLYDQ